MHEPTKGDSIWEIPVWGAGPMADRVVIARIHRPSFMEALTFVIGLGYQQISGIELRERRKG